MLKKKRLFSIFILKNSINKLLDNLTRATLRLAELGFLGLTTLIFDTTPFFWGQLFKERKQLKCFFFVFFHFADPL